jgi:hypothetical protein
MPLDRSLQLSLWLAEKRGRSFRPAVGVAAMRAGHAELNRRFGPFTFRNRTARSDPKRYDTV